MKQETTKFILKRTIERQNMVSKYKEVTDCFNLANISLNKAKKKRDRLQEQEKTKYAKWELYKSGELIP